MTVEEKVNEYINEAHLNKSSVARAMNISRDALYSILRGDRKISADEFLRFCKVVNRSIDDILHYGEIS